jgi:hypothetical protein
MEIDVKPADGPGGALGIDAPEAVDAVTGEKVLIKLAARAKGGSHVLFDAVQMPDSAVLDRYAGEVTWVAERSDAGPQMMQFRVRSGEDERDVKVLVRVRRSAIPTPVAYVNKTIPQTLEHLKRVQAGALTYAKIFEPIRLLRSRSAELHNPALQVAQAIYCELDPAFRRTCLDELSLHAWAFTDKPAVLEWMRRIAADDESAAARELIAKLDRMAELQALRMVETTGGSEQLPSLTAKLLATEDAWICSSIERAIQAICARSENKDAYEQAILRDE